MKWFVCYRAVPIQPMFESFAFAYVSEVLLQYKVNRLEVLEVKAN
jgi:hypothetical protein